MEVLGTWRKSTAMDNTCSTSMRLGNLPFLILRQRSESDEFGDPHARIVQRSWGLALGTDNLARPSYVSDPYHSAWAVYLAVVPIAAAFGASLIANITYSHYILSDSHEHPIGLSFVLHQPRPLFFQCPHHLPYHRYNPDSTITWNVLRRRARLVTCLTRPKN